MSDRKVEYTDFVPRWARDATPEEMTLWEKFDEIGVGPPPEKHIDELIAGSLSLRLTLWLFRKITIPWPHFAISAAAFAASCWCASHGELAWMLVSALGCLEFLMFAVVSRRLRRMMEMPS